MQLSALAPMRSAWILGPVRGKTRRDRSLPLMSCQTESVQRDRIVQPAYWLRAESIDGGNQPAQIAQQKAGLSANE